MGQYVRRAWRGPVREGAAEEIRRRHRVALRPGRRERGGWRQGRAADRAGRRARHVRPPKFPESYDVVGNP